MPHLYEYKHEFGWIFKYYSTYDNPPAFNVRSKFKEEYRHQLHRLEEEGHIVEIQKLYVHLPQPWIWEGEWKRWSLTGSTVCYFRSDVERPSAPLSPIVFTAWMAVAVVAICASIIAFFAFVAGPIITYQILKLTSPLPEEWICSDCGASFDSPEALTAHRKAEHPQEPSYCCAYKGCTICFFSNAELLAHYLVDHGGPPEPPPPPDGDDEDLTEMIIVAIVIVMVFVLIMAFMSMRK